MSGKADNPEPQDSPATGAGASGEAAPHPRVLRGKGLSIDYVRRRVLAGGQEVPLTPLEWALLEHLSQNHGQVVSHETLKAVLWGSEDVGDAALSACIRRLRLKLEDDPSMPRLILSRRGLGYVFLLSH